MSVLAVGSTARYRAWDPTAKQVAEPDTTYLMDLAVEALLGVAEGGMQGANEVSGLTADKPPWRGGSKVAVVAGKYRDGLQALGTSNNFLSLPASGLLAADQWTIEMFVKSAVPWASLSNQIAFRLLNDFGQYVRVTISAGSVAAAYRHLQDPAVAAIDKTATATGQTFAADAWVSVAMTVAAGVLRLYINGVQQASVTGCTPPAFWNDGWAGGYGLAVSIDAPNLTVSDVRFSRLARTPGQVPVAP